MSCACAHMNTSCWFRDRTLRLRSPRLPRCRQLKATPPTTTLKIGNLMEMEAAVPKVAHYLVRAPSRWSPRRRGWGSVARYLTSATPRRSPLDRGRGSTYPHHSGACSRRLSSGMKRETPFPTHYARPGSTRLAVLKISGSINNTT